MKKLNVILIGAGNRGKGYTDIMGEMQGKFKVIAVAEPILERREYIKNTHGIEDKYCFTTWEDVFKIPKFADVVIIATMDRMHYVPAMEAINKKYDILLEKPIAPTPYECAQIALNAEKNNVKVMVCHVLRYTEYYKGIKALIDSGKLGKIISVIHTEGVGNIHQSHSFVRGNWSKEEDSTPMILQKSCHDMDILQWLLGKEVKNIQSFGSLSYFNKENAPKDTPEYCIEGCPYEDTCYYNAVKLYYDDKENSWFRQTSTHKSNPDDNDVKKAISETPYGKCVFKCNNNVVDHQSVNIEFSDGSLAVFTMSAFCEGGRKTTFMGTKGELISDMEENKTIFYDFETKQKEEIKLLEYVKLGNISGGHGGGDSGIVNALYDYVNNIISKEEVSEIGISYKNHLIAFAAENARINNKIVDMKKFQEAFIRDKI